MSTGLLILFTPIGQLTSRLGSLAKAASQHVRNVLYVQIESTPKISSCRKFINGFYANCVPQSRALDVRFLLGSVKRRDPMTRIELSRSVDVVLSDREQLGSSYLRSRFADGALVERPFVYLNVDSNERIVEPDPELKTYDNVVLGGTFDRIHNGHRLLLDEAVLLCQKSLTVGVTDGPMIQGKLLWELIDPVDVRIENLRKYLNDTDSGLNYILEPIKDPYGPSVVDPALQCIVVSKETYKGGLKVNDQRVAKGMNALDIHCIELIDDCDHSLLEEEKISSSSLRMRSLGHRRKPLNPEFVAAKGPYVIGLTGGIASGKTSVASRLKDLGADVINCDLLGHKAYAKGTRSYQQIVERFGAKVLNPKDGSVDRKILGSLVFSDPKELSFLNGIVWPEIARLAREEINKSQSQVVVVEAAVLLEAGWEDFVQEIWVCIIPPAEAVSRIVNRNGLSEEEAKLRLDKQISNCERVKKAAVVFSTLWDPSFTQKQVEIAWMELNELLTKAEHKL